MWQIWKNFRVNIIYLPPKFYHRHFIACVLAYLSIPPCIQSFFILWPFKVNCRQRFIHFRLNTSACMSLRRLQCSFTFFSFDLKFISNEMHASEADFCWVLVNSYTCVTQTPIRIQNVIIPPKSSHTPLPGQSPPPLPPRGNSCPDDLVFINHRLVWGREIFKSLLWIPHLDWGRGRTERGRRRGQAL